MDSPLEFGAGQRWMAPVGGGMGRGRWCRRWWRDNASEAVGDRAVEVKCDADTYEVRLKVNDFAPDELAVKVKGGELVVEGEQSELPTTHGVSSRQFTRRFALPPGVEEDTLESQLTEDGFLVVSGKMKSSTPDRTIDISAKKS
ncbi:hypothetical protein NP493_365g00077 [Ridgeia piscesae]|uniref:SHSP domain-containing protein n=1 Tax=Ridgeia piscesae TaxID=27915 RepID=A0AAD9L2E9_RIDPI|nr:hypothetical protein NP493_365g00077 [Ridgeia piscesae]